MKSILILFAVYSAAILPMIFPQALYNFALNLGVSWTFSYILSWIVVILFSFITAFLCRKHVLGKARIWLPILAFVSPIGGYFASNPIYQGDFSKMGIEKSNSDNAVLADVLAYNPDFNGIVCVASPNCPYCVEAVRTKMKVLHKRNKIGVLVYLGFGDANTVEEFKERSNAHDVTFLLNSDPDGGIDIDEPVIPVFIYIKNGEIVHLWRNDQIGYPAMDWMESGLN